MKNIVRLLIAVVFGAIAAVLNWMWMSSERDYPSYVTASEPIALGETIIETKLAPVAIKGDPSTLSETLVPWSQKSNWLNRPAARDYRANDPFLQRDLLELRETTQWDILGPFTLIGIGSEATVAFGGRPGQLIPTAGNILTLAVQEGQEAERDLLYRYLAAAREKYYFNESADERRLLEIIAVEPELSALAAEPPPKTSTENLGDDPATRAAMQEHVGDRLMFVSLSEIPNTPAFLRIGEQIRFIVPPGKALLQRSAPAATKTEQTKAGG